MFRVWDIEEEKWVSSNVIKFNNGDIADIKKGKIGNKYKINLMSDNRYIYQRNIGCIDSTDTMIYEGDILQAVNGIIGLVAYAEEQASYLLFDYVDSKYYPLGTDICKHLKIVGNVFENQDLIGVEVLANEGKESKQAL